MNEKNPSDTWFGSIHASTPTASNMRIAHFESAAGANQCLLVRVMTSSLASRSSSISLTSLSSQPIPDGSIVAHGSKAAGTRGARGAHPAAGSRPLARLEPEAIAVAHEATDRGLRLV